MPFRLAYGSEAVILAEVGLTSYRVGNYNGDKIEEAMRLQLDLVDEVQVMQSKGWRNIRISWRNTTTPRSSIETFRLEILYYGR